MKRLHAILLALSAGNATWLLAIIIYFAVFGPFGANRGTAIPALDPKIAQLGEVPLRRMSDGHIAVALAPDRFAGQGVLAPMPYTGLSCDNEGAIYFAASLLHRSG